MNPNHLCFSAITGILAAQVQELAHHTWPITTYVVGVRKLMQSRRAFVNLCRPCFIHLDCFLYCNDSSWPQFSSLVKTIRGLAAWESTHLDQNVGRFGHNAARPAIGQNAAHFGQNAARFRRLHSKGSGSSWFRS